MKNISRRVFIKGLAVAGVAAAASTVLAGCNTNMIPGVGTDTDKDDEVTEPAATNKYTFTTVDGETLVISAPSAVTSTVNVTAGSASVGIALAVDNDLGKNVKFVKELPTTATSSSEDYVVVLSAKVSDENGDTVASNVSVASTASSFNGKCILNKVVADGASGNYVYGWANKAGVKDWGKIVVTAKVHKKIEAVGGKAYMYGKTEVDKYEFTYTR